MVAIATPRIQKKILVVEPRRKAKPDDLLLYNTFLIPVGGVYKGAYFHKFQNGMYFFKLSGASECLPPFPTLAQIYLL